MAANDKSALLYAVQIGTEDGLPLYACRSAAGAGVLPGRFRSDFAGCHIAIGGKEISVPTFEVLSSSWQDGAEGTVPPESFETGERAQLGPDAHFSLTMLSPCRARYQDSLQVGEVAPGDRGCSFGFAGREVTELKYEVLWRAPWLTWLPAIAQQLPIDAVAAGYEGGEPFYICRASGYLGMHSGKVKRNATGCSIASRGQEVVTTHFSVLVPLWLAGTAGSLPMAALPVGYEKENLLYLCRAHIRHAAQVGKIADPLTSCHVGMLGGEIPSLAYEVLSER
jgi:hypothetical protein